MNAHASAAPASRTGRHAGSTALKVVVIVVAGVVASGAMLYRVLPLIDRTERLAFVQVHRQLQSALTLEAATLIAEGHSNRLLELGTINPISLIFAPPHNYLGSLPWPNPDGLPGGTWYFDEHTRSLAYRVGKHTRFDALGGPPNRVEFRVAFLFEDRNGDAEFDAAGDHFEALRLEPRHAYRWPE